MFDDNIPEQRRSRKVTLLLIVLPLWLLVSGGAALWLYFHQAKKDAAIEAPRSPKPISKEDMDATMNKVLTFVGERNSSSPAAAKGLQSMMSMIDGTLGYGNTGYALERLATPPTPLGSWPIVIAKIHGRQDDEKAVWIVVPCDSRPGSPGAVSNGSGAVTAMAIAEDLAATPVGRSVYFAFVPHGIDPSGPTSEVVRILRERLIQDPAKALVVVERMGKAEKLQAWGADVTSSFDQAVGRGDFQQKESNLGFLLKEAQLPVTVISTAEPLADTDLDGGAPDPALMAASAQSLKQLIIKLAEKKN